MTSRWRPRFKAVGSWHWRGCAQVVDADVLVACAIVIMHLRVAERAFVWGVGDLCLRMCYDGFDVAVVRMLIAAGAVAAAIADGVVIVGSCI